MTGLENRLRQQLPELADALSATGAQSHQPGVASIVDATPEQERRDEVQLLGTDPDRMGSKHHRPFVAAAAAVVLVLALGVATNRYWRGTDDGVGVMVALASFGTWSALPDAPIVPRAYASTAWTGDEVVFWAGTDLNRGFVQADGAAYDPATSSWRQLTVPGWGHPGLTSSFLDGELYALAKGGGTRFDPVAGEWADLPPVEDMFLAATVATDAAVWGIGPAGSNPDGSSSEGTSDLAIARYQPSTDSWNYGPVHEGTDGQAAIVEGLALLETTTLWTGSEIVVWSGNLGGLAFEPATETWRSVEPVRSPSGEARDSTAVGIRGGFAVLVDDGEGGAHLATQLDSEWRSFDDAIPFADFETITLASAGEWILAFSANDAPVVIHTSSGIWSRAEDAPLRGLQAPNTAWTGEQLIVWGGAADDGSLIDNPEGAIWTPPTN